MANLPSPSNGEAEIAAIIGSAMATFAELERERLAIQREQQAVARRSWEVTDASDRRQNETIVKGIEADTDKDKRRHRLAIIVLLTVAGIPALFLLMLLLMAFFGNSAQADIALRILTIAGTGIGGAGVVFLVGYGINRLLAR